MEEQQQKAEEQPPHVQNGSVQKYGYRPTGEGMGKDKEKEGLGAGHLDSSDVGGHHRNSDHLLNSSRSTPLSTSGPQYNDTFNRENAKLPIRPTISFRERLALVKEYSAWVLEKDVELGMRIFIGASNLEVPLDKIGRVVTPEWSSDPKKLKQIKFQEVSISFDDSFLTQDTVEELVSYLSTFGTVCCQQYLEHLSASVQSPYIHTNLGIFFVNVIKENVAMMMLEHRVLHGDANAIENVQQGERFRDDESTRAEHNFLRLKMGEVGQEEGSIGVLRLKLLSFLRKSALLDPQKVLDEINNVPLLQEKIVLHMKAGHFEEALRLLVHGTKEYDLAEKYCNALDGDRVAAVDGREQPPLTLSSLSTTSLPYISSATSTPTLPSRSHSSSLSVSDGIDHSNHTSSVNHPSRRSISLILLKLYFEDSSPAAPPSSPSALSATVDFKNLTSLQRRGLRWLLKLESAPVDLLLSAIPPHVPVYVLLPFMKKIFSEKECLYRETQIRRNLYSKHHQETEVQLVNLKKQSITITEEARCHVCRKYIGCSVLAVLNGCHPAHVQCAKLSET